MGLSVWLVFFLKEMLLEAMKLNMNKPYFSVDIEEFILYVEIELLANAVNIDLKCRVFINEIMDILRKDELKLYCVNMDIITFRDIIKINGQHIELSLKKNTRKKIIDMILSAFCLALNARMWHYSLESFEITRLEWEEERIKLMKPRIKNDELQLEITKKNEEWCSNQLKNYPSFQNAVYLLQRETAIKGIDYKSLARLNSWIIEIQNRMNSVVWHEEKNECLQPILEQILVQLQKMGLKNRSENLSLISMDTFFHRFKLLDACRFSEWTSEQIGDIIEILISSFMCAASTCEWTDILKEQMYSSDQLIRSLSETSFLSCIERLENQIGLSTTSECETNDLYENISQDIEHIDEINKIDEKIESTYRSMESSKPAKSTSCCMIQ